MCSIFRFRTLAFTASHYLQSGDLKVLSFLERLRYSSGTGSSFANAQELLKTEPKMNRVAELENLEVYVVNSA